MSIVAGGASGPVNVAAWGLSGSRETLEKAGMCVGCGKPKPVHDCALED